MGGVADALGRCGGGVSASAVPTCGPEGEASGALEDGFEESTSLVAFNAGFLGGPSGEALRRGGPFGEAFGASAADSDGCSDTSGDSPRWGGPSCEASPLSGLSGEVTSSIIFAELPFTSSDAII